MLKVVLSGRFKKSFKRAGKRGKDLTKLDWVISQLAQQLPLSQQYKDHKLSGDYFGTRECHIEPDWLLVYKIENGKLNLVNTGTHSDLF